MKKIYFLLFFILILIFAGIFISCDILLPAPLGRNNPFDNEAQIGRFAAVISGQDSIITAWDWRNPPSGIDDSRKIDKIRIVHSENDPPTSKYPLNPNNVKEYTSNSEWKAEWDNLRNDREHYFALYAHEKGGVWLAPKRVSRNFDNTGHEERLDISFKRLGIDTSIDTNQVQIGVGQVTDIAPLGLPPYKIGFIRFDELFNNEYGIVSDARIYTNAGATAGDLLIVPVRRHIEDGMQWGMINDLVFYDYKNALLVNITGAIQYIDIKDQINIARLHGSNTIVFIPNSGSLVNMDLLNFGFNDLMVDTFSVWRNN